MLTRYFAQYTRDQLNTESNAVSIRNIFEHALDDSAHMKRDTIGRLGRTEDLID